MVPAPATGKPLTHIISLHGMGFRRRNWSELAGNSSQPTPLSRGYRDGQGNTETRTNVPDEC